MIIDGVLSCRPILKRHVLKTHTGCETLCDNLITGEKNIKPPTGHRHGTVAYSTSAMETDLAPDDELQSLASGASGPAEDVEYPYDDAVDDVSTLPDGLLKLNCTLCCYSCVHDQEFLHHMNTEHAIPVEKVPLRCGFCSFITYEDFVFEQHVRSHRVFKPYECAHCGYKDFTHSKVKLHCTKHHPDLPILVMEQAEAFEGLQEPPDSNSPLSHLVVNTRSTLQPLVRLSNVAAMPEELLDTKLAESGVSSVTW